MFKTIFRKVILVPECQKITSQMGRLSLETWVSKLKSIDLFLMCRESRGRKLGKGSKPPCVTCMAVAGY